MLKLGDKNITKLYYGAKAISKAFLGEKQVYNAVSHTEIEYLEGDKTSYINTGVIGKADLTFDIELYTPTTSIAGYTLIIGSSDGTNRFYPVGFYGGRFAHRCSGSSEWRTGNDGVIKAGAHRFLIKTSTQKDVGIVWSGTTETMAYYGAWEYVDGELVPRSLHTSALKDSTTEMYLFAINNNGTATVGNSNFTDATGYLRIKACKIWDKDANRNDVLIRDFIAVERSDGVKCLYDKVEGKYYEFQQT